MAALSDVSVGWLKESTYNTPVTPSKWVEFTDESLDYTRTTKQGSGLRVGASGIPLASRRISPTKAGSGSIQFEMQSKGMGTLLEAAMGSGTSTLVSGTTYQQNFVFGSLAVPLTIQKGLVDASGTVHPYTFAGCTCTGFEISVPHTDFAMLKTDWDICSLNTATAYTAPTYPASPTVYHWGMAAVTIGGSVTYPTTNALASGGTAVTNVRDFSLSVGHNLAADRYLMSAGGLKARPTPGQRSMSGSITVDYVDDVLRDALVADTALPIVVTLTSAEALSTGTATLQIVLSHCRLDGELPKSNKGAQITTSFKFMALSDGTNAPLTIVLRTADTAL